VVADNGLTRSEVVLPGSRPEVRQWPSFEQGGKATLMLVRTEESPAQGELAISQQKRGALDYARLLDDLRAVESTEAGFTILREAELTRSELERLSRSLDLPVTKQDSAGHLEEKVVEALIGSRLNSRAIRGR
jgi:hypothetical protein